MKAINLSNLIMAYESFIMHILLCLTCHCKKGAICSLFFLSFYAHFCFLLSFWTLKTKTIESYLEIIMLMIYMIQNNAIN